MLIYAIVRIWVQSFRTFFFFKESCALHCNAVLKEQVGVYNSGVWWSVLYFVPDKNNMFIYLLGG